MAAIKEGKSKVIKLEALDKREGSKNDPFNVTFEDGTRGFTLSRFTEGEIMDYVAEERPQKKDPTKTYTYITRPKQDDYRGGKKYEKDFMGLIIGTGQAYCIDLLLLPQFIDMRLRDIEDVIIPVMQMKLKEMLTDREKGFISYTMDAAIKMYSNETIRKRLLDSLKAKEVTPEVELDLIVSIFRQLLKDKLDFNKAVTIQ